MNADGLNDLLIATLGVDVALDPGNNSSPTTWTRRNFPSNVMFDDVATADLDGDGRLDIVASSYTANLIQWWLTGTDISPRASSYIALGSAQGPTSATKCDATPTSEARVVVGSVSLVDVDDDGQIELGVSTFGHGLTIPTEVAVYTYSKESGCFRKVRSRAGLGAMATQFVDLNSDGRQDLVVSLQSVQPAGGGDMAQWGEWFDLPPGEHELIPQPLLVPFSGANANHNIGVVDFDVLPPEPPTGAGVGRAAWFALAITTHQSPFDQQHKARRGGHIEVVDSAGTRVWSSEEWEKTVEDESTGEFLMPMTPRFTRGRGLLASFLRGHALHSDCPYFQKPCAGPVLHVPSLQHPSPETLSGDHYGVGFVELFTPAEPTRGRFIVFADLDQGLGVIER